MGGTSNRQQPVKHSTATNTMRNAPRGTRSGNRDESPDPRDIKRESEKPKSKD